MYNLTDLANKTIQVASQFATNYTNEVGTEHILYALSKVESKSKKLLQAHRVNTDIIVQIIENVGNKGIPSSVVDLTPRVREMLAIASSVVRVLFGANILFPTPCMNPRLLTTCMDVKDHCAISPMSS